MERRRFVLVFVAILIATAAWSFTGFTEQSFGKLNPVQVGASCDDFRLTNDINKSVRLIVHGRLEVILCFNPSTGYQWPDSAEIRDQSVIWQTSHTTLPGESEKLGAPAQERWTFLALDKGTTSVSFSYGRPWEESSQDSWHFTVQVTVVEEAESTTDKIIEQTGEELVREVFLHIHNSNIQALENMLSEHFQSVHEFGASDRQGEIDILKNIELGEYSLSNFQVTGGNDIIIVTYNLTAKETIQGKEVPHKPVPRLSVFINTNSGWKWLAHANLS